MNNDEKRKCLEGLLDTVAQAIDEAYPVIAQPREWACLAPEWSDPDWGVYARRERRPESLFEFSVLSEEDAPTALPFLCESLRWVAERREAYDDVFTSCVCTFVSWNEPELRSLDLLDDVHTILTLLPWAWRDSYEAAGEATLRHFRESDQRGTRFSHTWLCFSLATGEAFENYLDALWQKANCYDHPRFQLTYDTLLESFIEATTDPWASGHVLDLWLRFLVDFLSTAMFQSPQMVELMGNAELLRTHWLNARSLIVERMPTEYVAVMRQFLSDHGIETA